MQTKKKATKERSHSVINKKKIAVALAKNPSWTLREIAKEAWVSKSTVENKLGQVGQIKEKWLEDLLSVDIQIMESATNEINRRINDDEEKKQIKATELSQIAQHSADRYMKFRWNTTDEKWWLSAEAIKSMSVDELLSIIKK